MAREQVEAASKEQVLTSLGTATSRLREKLGESLASIQKFDVPLPRATTASLEALHAYSLALDQGSVSPARRSDSASQAGHRARPELRDGAGAPVGVSTRTPVSRRGPGVCPARVRIAGPGQRARAVLHFVALLHRRRAGVGQGVGAGAVVDRDVSARSVCVQQPRASRPPLRSARSGRRGLPRSASASTPSSCRLIETWSGP